MQNRYNSCSRRRNNNFTETGSITDSMIHEGYAVHGFSADRKIVPNYSHRIKSKLSAYRYCQSKDKEKDIAELQRIRDTGLVSTGAEGAAITRIFYLMTRIGDEQIENILF